MTLCTHVLFTVARVLFCSPKAYTCKCLSDNSTFGLPCPCFREQVQARNQAGGVGFSQPHLAASWNEVKAFYCLTDVDTQCL